MKFIKSIFVRIFRCDFGSLKLKHGEHDVHVPTRICVSSVWVKTKDKGHDGCGQKQFNWVRCETKDKGIDFHVKVNTEQCIIDWFAT